MPPRTAEAQTHKLTITLPNELLTRMDAVVPRRQRNAFIARILEEQLATARRGSSPQHVLIELEMPADVDRFSLPQGVNGRLQDLLDRQDRGEDLTSAERMEAEGLVNLAELLSLLRWRAPRVLREEAPQPR